MFFLYNVLLGIGFAILLPKFLLDAWRHGKYITGLHERLGFVEGLSPKDGPVLWLHCVSVGETQAARPLLQAIRRDFPHYRVVVSTITVTGQLLAREIFKDEVERVLYFPLDWPWSVRGAIRAIEPSVVLLMETELWPSFLRECQRRTVPSVIVNGRLSEKSFRRYQLIRSFISRVVNYLDLAIMQTESDAQRIRALGLASDKALVSGNIKFDAGTTREVGSVTTEFAVRFGLAGRHVILAASTHDPEERLVVEAFQDLLRQPRTEPRLIIAPRHPQRFADVAVLLNASGLRWARRTAARKPDDENCQIILLDTIGELRSILPLSSIAFVGGSIAPVGGHNILEPAVEGACIVTGAHTANFQEIVATFLKADALIQLPDLPETQLIEKLAGVLGKLLDNPEHRNALIERARNLVDANRGATERTMQVLRTILTNSPVPEATRDITGARPDLQST